MSDLIFNNVSRVFPGGVVAVDGFSLTVPSPTMVVLVGPSGCGKTTLLRMIAGLETPSSGTIHLGERRLDTLEPRNRDIAMVFQSYALYPHMTVAKNLSFGLRVRKVPAAEIETRVRRVARQLEIEPLLDRKPAELSGGQRQRVALGRAIIREPRVFLFDEPLSNLDARLRTEMRAMIKRLYQQLRVTSVYVTHDQVEAMTVGEMLVVMNEGRIHQVASPEECYRRPADTFVASFLGSPPMNLITGGFDDAGSAVVVGETRIELPRGTTATGASVTIGFRPEDVLEKPPAGANVVLAAEVTLEEPMGHEVLTHMRTGACSIVARGDRRFAEKRTSVYIAQESLHVFDTQTGNRLPGYAGKTE